jgi:hypothetical protein
VSRAEVDMERRKGVGIKKKKKRADALPPCLPACLPACLPTHALSTRLSSPYGCGFPQGGMLPCPLPGRPDHPSQTSRIYKEEPVDRKARHRCLRKADAVAVYHGKMTRENTNGPRYPPVHSFDFWLHVTMVVLSVPQPPLPLSCALHRRPFVPIERSR